MPSLVSENRFVPFIQILVLPRCNCSDPLVEDIWQPKSCFVSVQEGVFLRIARTCLLLMGKGFLRIGSASCLVACLHSMLSVAAKPILHFGSAITNQSLPPGMPQYPDVSVLA
jgi:hypothetical protein